MNRVPPLLFLFFFVGSFVFVSCGKSENKSSKTNRQKTRTVVRTKFVKPAAVSQDYVGSEACRQCHAEIMKEYESHPMSVSMSVAKDYPVEDYSKPESIDAGKGATWTATKKDGQIVHEEVLQDADGRTLAKHDETIDFTCGSGTRGCSYFMFKSGKLFQSPVTWYSKKKKWDLSPGYVPPHHPRVDRSASDACLACHAGRMNPVEDERDTYDAEKPFHELAIGCERCHGPGKDHIDFHEQGTNKDSAKDPIVNPDNLSPAQREAVCYQCHLQGERRVTRYGRSEFDFRPGMHVSDIWITFLKSGDTSGGSTQAVSQVEQMHSSQCYIQSKGAFGCVSCHDPHRSPQADERIGFYRDKCIACHQSSQDQSECTVPPSERKEKSPEDSCIQCHMPKLNAGDVAHTSQTDHRVHIPGDNYQYQTEKTDGFRVWNDTKVPIYEIERAKTIALAGQAFLRHDPTLADKALEGLRFFHPISEDDLMLQESMAQLYSAKGDPVEASRIWTKLLKLFPRDEYLLTTVSLALHEEGKFEDAYPIYKQLCLVNGHKTQVLFRCLDICTRLNKFNEGMGIAERILEIDPGAKKAHQWLARAYEVKGDPEKSSYHLDMSKRIISE